MHHSQHSRSLHRMCFPSLHVIYAAAQLSHFLHTLHELLHSKLCKAKVTRDEKGWVKSFVIELRLCLECVVKLVNPFTLVCPSNDKILIEVFSCKITQSLQLREFLAKNRPTAWNKSFDACFGGCVPNCIWTIFLLKLKTIDWKKIKFSRHFDEVQM